VVVSKPFDVTIGLAPTPDERVVGGPMERPSTSVGPYTLTVQVVADGFDLADGSTGWRTDLPVTAEAPYPTQTLRLSAKEAASPIRAGTIRAMYSVDGQAIGLAVRPVAIVRDARLLSAAPAAPAEPGVDLSVPTAAVPPDLTVRIEVAGSQSSGRLLWQLLVADGSISVPDEPITVDIGQDPEAFLALVVAQMNEVEGSPAMYRTLVGIGNTVAEQIPQAFWDVFAAVAARTAPRPPLVLFLSAEPYVPWELAVVDPPIDPASPPFLSAQATVGRWVLGQRRPKLPPPVDRSVDGVAVVSGVYPSVSGWERLLEAEAEAAAITASYGGAAVNAETTAILELIDGRPPADVLHFAVHGTWEEGATKEGLILVDGRALSPLVVRGSRMERSPFVFLNACQVGSGRQLLGDYSGMAEAFLFAGASAVVAPLWSVDDEMARLLAVRFYERVFSGEPPAEVLRAERATFSDKPQTVSSTYLAYQFFGHPALKLTRATP
jgi:hypothetical protein